MSRLPAPILLGALLAQVALARPVAAQEPPAAEPDPAVHAASVAPLAPALQLFELVNQKRAEAGLPPYTLDARLMASAQAHSADMAASRRCRHMGSDGSSAKARIRRHGYPHNNWAGENILCSRRAPADALRWWLASAPHRRNLLHRHYVHLGVGYDPNGPYGPMWTLNFAAGAAQTAVPLFLAPEPAVEPEGLPAAAD